MRIVSEAGGLMLAYVAAAEREGFVDIGRLEEEEEAAGKFGYRLTETGAEVAEALGLDPWSADDLPLFTMIYGMSLFRPDGSEELPLVVGLDMLDSFYRARTGRGLVEGVKRAEEVLGIE